MLQKSSAAQAKKIENRHSKNGEAFSFGPDSKPFSIFLAIIFEPNLMHRTLFLVFFSLQTAFVFAQISSADSLAATKEVDSLIQVSRTLTGQSQFDKALEANAVAEKIALEKLGRESAAYGSCCFNRGRALHYKMDYPEAEKWYLESKSIREKALGKEHLDYAWSLNNLGNLYKYLGNYQKAESHYLEAKNIRKKNLGNENPDYASSLFNLANLYRTLGNYENAETLFLEVTAIEEKLLGKEHPNYAEDLSNMADLYHDMGDYKKAEPFYLQAKVIIEKVFGKQQPQYAQILNGMALLYTSKGEYEKAELLHFEAMTIREKVFGSLHPDFAASLNNLALLYFYMGNYEKAEPFLLEARTIQEKALGTKHPDFTVTLNNLANMYQVIGDYEKAESYYLESIAIREKVFGKEHQDVAINLDNLAELYTTTGNYAKAESLQLDAKAIREKTLGKNHPEYGSSLHNLASLYLKMGKFEKAETLQLEAKAIEEKTLGKNHTNYAQSLSNLADLYEKQNKFSASEPLLTEQAALEQTRLSKSVTFLSERELANYAALFQKLGDQLGGCLLARPSEKSGNLPALVFDQALFQKGFLLTAAARLNSPAAATAESDEINNRLKGYRRRLATEYAKPIADRKGVAELEEKANSAEKELARTISGYAEATRQVKWQEVQSALKTGQAAIEFVHFNIHFPKKTDSTMYAALVLLPAAEHPIFISLFEEKSLDSLLKNSGDRKADYVNTLYTFADRGAVAIEKPKKSLFEILWQPLEPHLVDVKTVFFSPSGLLHRLNLAAIPINEDQNLADRFQLVQLKSSRQLVVPDQPKTAQNKAVLFGGIDFEPDSTVAFSASGDLAARSRGADFGFEKTDDALRAAYPIFSDENSAATKKGFFKKRKKTAASASRGSTWGYLPGTEKEIAAIEKLLSGAEIAVQTNRSKAATEEVFKKIGTEKTGSPKVLHLATHGYFFPDPKAKAQAGDPVFKISEHPMLRSGLILAGGNAAWQGQKTLEGREDGILTAFEISQMNLANTELVVLSACETGLGDIAGNEGVYGLQRAFKIAGAKYLIMSLWQVPDRQTTELMKAFYQKWLVEKMEIPDAFRAAQQAMRDRFVDPYAWAGFVLIE